MEVWGRVDAWRSSAKGNARYGVVHVLPPHEEAWSDEQLRIIDDGRIEVGKTFPALIVRGARGYWDVKLRLPSGSELGAVAVMIGEYRQGDRINCARLTLPDGRQAPVDIPRQTFSEGGWGALRQGGTIVAEIELSETRYVVGSLKLAAAREVFPSEEGIECLAEIALVNSKGGALAMAWHPELPAGVWVEIERLVLRAAGLKPVRRKIGTASSDDLKQQASANEVSILRIRIEWLSGDLKPFVAEIIDPVRMELARSGAEIPWAVGNIAPVDDLADEETEGEIWAEVEDPIQVRALISKSAIKHERLRAKLQPGCRITASLCVGRHGVYEVTAIHRIVLR